MTTTTLDGPAAVATTRTPTGLAVVGTLLALNGAVLGPRLFLDSRPYSEAAGDTLHLVHYVVWTACLVALTQLWPRVPGLPRGILTLAAVGAALDACTRFVSAFVSPYLAARAPDLLDSTPDAILLVPLLGSGVVAMAGIVTVAVVAWRRGMLPLPGAVLLGLGGLAIPAVGPVANVLLGAGLVWLARSIRRSR